ncbi:MAG: sigma-54-dependent Fis family transcriptional regulator [Treponema sp.]|nr:sigma-54-dependent Fis family transcriptional regulator [Treponema sp.]
MERVLIIDDEAAICSSLEFALEDRFRTASATDAEEGLRLASEEAFDLCLLDLRIGENDGIRVLESLRRLPDPPVVIMMTAFGSIESSVRAMRLGAFGYLEKPLNMEALLAAADQALEHRRLHRRVERLSRELEERFGPAGIVGKSPAMRRVFDLVDKLKDVDTTVVVRGESGVGKELVARALHYGGRRRSEPFVAVNCGAIPEALLEGELFGYRRGAFTGALEAKQGKFEYAGGGTILLDEIGDLPLPLQVKLLQVLQQREITPLGRNEPVKVNARVVAATNVNLSEAVEAGRFRSDLYFRLKVVEIHVPPLRERREDIPLLLDHFTAKFSREMRKTIRGFSEDALRFLLAYSFPGNVRELANLVEHGVLMAESPEIGLGDLPGEIRGYSNPRVPTEEEAIRALAGKSLREVEGRLIRAALERFGGRRKAAAESLGISERGLRNKIEEYGLKGNG